MTLTTKQGLEITMTDGATARHTPLKDGSVRINWCIHADFIQVESHTLRGRAWTPSGTPCYYPLIHVKKIEITGPSFVEP